MCTVTGHEDPLLIIFRGRLSFLNYIGVTLEASHQKENSQKNINFGKQQWNIHLFYSPAYAVNSSKVLCYLQVFEALVHYLHEIDFCNHLNIFLAIYKSKYKT